jgi:hypothetical protein
MPQMINGSRVVPCSTPICSWRSVGIISNLLSSSRCIILPGRQSGNSSGTLAAPGLSLRLSPASLSALTLVKTAMIIAGASERTLLRSTPHPVAPKSNSSPIAVVEMEIVVAVSGSRPLRSSSYCSVDNASYSLGKPLEIRAELLLLGLIAEDAESSFSAQATVPHAALPKCSATSLVHSQSDMQWLAMTRTGPAFLLLQHLLDPYSCSRLDVRLSSLYLSVSLYSMICARIPYDEFYEYYVYYETRADVRRPHNKHNKSHQGVGM